MRINIQISVLFAQGRYKPCPGHSPSWRKNAAKPCALRSRAPRTGR